MTPEQQLSELSPQEPKSLEWQIERIKKHWAIRFSSSLDDGRALLYKQDTELLITALQQANERVEALEKALGQAVDLAELEYGEAPARAHRVHNTRTFEFATDVPELAAYLKAKQIQESRTEQPAVGGETAPCS